MRFEVETGRRRRTIEIQPAGNGWAVQVDGRRVWVDLARSGDRWSMLVRDPAPGSGGVPAASGLSGVQSSHEVAVEVHGSGRRLVHLDGRSVPVAFVPAARVAHAPSGAASVLRPAAIVAPMPGRVVKVLVKPGDLVAARQGVVVVEAMKMENELRAPHAGIVTEVRAREGASVEANGVLVVIEPHK